MPKTGKQWKETDIGQGVTIAMVLKTVERLLVLWLDLSNQYCMLCDDSLYPIEKSVNASLGKYLKTVTPLVPACLFGKFQKAVERAFVKHVEWYGWTITVSGKMVEEDDDA